MEQQKRDNKHIDNKSLYLKKLQSCKKMIICETEQLSNISYLNIYVSCFLEKNKKYVIQIYF